MNLHFVELDFGTNLLINAISSKLYFRGGILRFDLVQINCLSLKAISFKGHLGFIVVFSIYIPCDGIRSLLFSSFFVWCATAALGSPQSDAIVVHRLLWWERV